MHNYFRLLRYAQRERAFLILIFLLTLATAGLAALQPWPLNFLVDHVLGTTPLPAPVASALQTFGINPTRSGLLVAIVLGGLLLFGLSSTADAALTWTWTVAGRRMVYSVSQDLLARLQRRCLLFHKTHAVGDLLSRVTVDSWCVYRLVDSLVFSPLYALLTIAAMVFLMAQLNAKLTMVALGVAPFMVLGSLLVGKPLRAAARLKREIESRIQAHIQQTLTGIPVVQAFTQEDQENLRFQHFAEAAIRTQQRSALIGGINGLSSGLVTTLGSGVILWIGAHDVLRHSLTVGGLLVFLFYLNALKAQIKVLAGLYTTLQGLSASASRVVEMLDSPSDLFETPKAAALSKARGDVRFENVTAGYTSGHPVLKDIFFDLPAGHTFAIVGATGAGKTTLVSLVPRFADPWEGRVLLDGKDLRALRLSDLRNQVALVLQEPFLLPLSISENIAYGRPGASRQEIEAAARAANAEPFITALPNGYETVIGERGATLSGGERQRIAIARALLKDAPILILDEPTSALDAGTEQLIMEALQRLMKGRTTLIVTHRLSMVRYADRVIVLDKGQIVESGTPEALLELGGHYARLQRLQNGMPATAAAT